MREKREAHKHILHLKFQMRNLSFIVELTIFKRATIRLLKQFQQQVEKQSITPIKMTINTVHNPTRIERNSEFLSAWLALYTNFYNLRFYSETQSSNKTRLFCLAQYLIMTSRSSYANTCCFLSAMETGKRRKAGQGNARYLHQR